MSDCVECGMKLTGPRKTKYCSTACRAKAGADKWRSANGVRMPLSTATVGAMHELMVAADLMRRGFVVFRAMSPSAPADLAALHNGGFLLIEVTTGYRNLNGQVMYPKKPIHYKFDIVAAVERTGVITYFPDLPEVEAMPKPPLLMQKMSFDERHMAVSSPEG